MSDEVQIIEEKTTTPKTVDVARSVKASNNRNWKSSKIDNSTGGGYHASNADTTNVGRTPYARYSLPNRICGDATAIYIYERLFRQINDFDISKTAAIIDILMSKMDNKSLFPLLRDAKKLKRKVNEALFLLNGGGSDGAYYRSNTYGHGNKGKKSNGINVAYGSHANGTTKTKSDKINGNGNINASGPDWIAYGPQHGSLTFHKRNENPYDY